MSDSNKSIGPGGTVRLEEPDDFRANVARALKSRLAPRLVMIAGPDAGTSVRLEGGVTVGRGRGADVVLTDASVSTLHVRFEDRGDAWAVVDLRSTNGMRVDDQRVSEALLSHHTKVQIGMTVLRFEIQDEADHAYDDLVQRLISVDDLSGLYLRRRFDRELGALLSAANGSVGLLVMDLDGIKKLNDTHGHLFGAHVIGEAGRRIGRLLAQVPGAFGARFGGDEYTVAAPSLTRSALLAFAERLRVEVADSTYTKDDLELRVGVSIGVALAPDDGATLATLFAAADQAMYRAKTGGRNRVSG